MTLGKQRFSPAQIFTTAVATLVVWTALGFSLYGTGFGCVTKGGAERRTEAAVMTSHASICVAQARAAPDSEAALEKLASLSLWKQSEFVETSQWSIMPGSDSARNGVSTECARMLLST
jgi:hypothetical protein